MNTDQIHPTHPSHYFFLGLGAALGSAVGLIIGVVLMFWYGERIQQCMQRGVRRISGNNDDRPNLDVFLQ